jgi:hypothetical protein
MTSNELWNVNTLKLPSTITEANKPRSSTATTLNTEIDVLKPTRVTKKAEPVGFQSDHKDLKTKSKETKALLDKDKAVLKKLASKTQTLLEATYREKGNISTTYETNRRSNRKCCTPSRSD